jgi:transposase InsO family protein
MCKVIKISRQSYYKAQIKASQRKQKEEEIVRHVITQRYQMPMLGGRKLLYLLKEETGINIGRDRFFNILREKGLEIKKKIKYVYTTDSNHPYKKYDNIIKGRQIQRADEVYVSDITYLRTEEGYSYLSLVTDLYSRKILGYELSRSLDTGSNIRALDRAIKDKEELTGIIHHSDRGTQYCSHEYTEKLQSKGMEISMSAKGNPYENAVAERINGILKQEFILGQKFKTRAELEIAVKEAIKNYNEKRPHLSLGYKTPSAVYNLSRATPS